MTTRREDLAKLNEKNMKKFLFGAFEREIELKIIFDGKFLHETLINFLDELLSKLKKIQSLFG